MAHHQRARRIVPSVPEYGEKAWNVRWIVLPIAIERRDPLAARVGDSRMDCRALPVCLAMSNHPHTPISTGERRQTVERVVGARVIDENHLVVDVSVERAVELGRERKHIALLVVHRDHDGELRPSRKEPRTTVGLNHFLRTARTTRAPRIAADDMPAASTLLVINLRR